ncbi:hypothetical protein EHV15_34630 [Paenibacillus oralis]|uniref:Uncharacterized protein n=1 Tax=Paenibacillus oralis TaxID=2490856 RepID=A0A3P3T9M8_9BACL|nr:hypothetical protein [Paenibacillus oralis]RRJ54736.1 hypothetical protein EHV15_34630 [Paenibacillus oralis]
MHYSKRIQRISCDLLVYLYTYQEFDVYVQRNLEEIVSLINAIPQNKGRVRNGIIFEGSFDYLVKHIKLLNKMARLFENRMNGKYSLGDFIVFLRSEGSKRSHLSLIARVKNFLVPTFFRLPGTGDESQKQ